MDDQCYTFMCKGKPGESGYCKECIAKWEPLTPVSMTGGKRTNLKPAESLSKWWVGFGKDEGCQFEGPWEAMAILAAKILRHPNTKLVAPNLHMPDIPLTQEQESHY